jgi:hypothetical protein
MSTNVPNQVPFLRTSRNFPEEAQPLAVEVNRSYVDIAEKVNERTIGIFATNRGAVTGESWFLTSQRQRTLRQIFSITGPGNINHGININSVVMFTRIYGTFVDNSTPVKYFPLPYVDATAANNQIQLVVTSTQIQVTAGGGAPPTIVKGIVVLEWLTNV